jgi:threonine aldolase
MAYSAEEKQAIRSACTVVVPGHPRRAPGEALIEIGQWCELHQYEADMYGAGKLINEFESKVAGLLGKDAAVFMPSGTMAQQIAARIWADREGNSTIGMHPTCHLENHEQKGYAYLHNLKPVLVGDRTRPILAKEIDALATVPACLIVELPAREIGGQLPKWDELLAIKAKCRERGIRLCLDGARLWEARAFYAGKSYADICEGFDSVYVSFYKGIGAPTGAMLLGESAFIAEARIWQRRHGGNLFQQLSYVAGAAMQFEQRLARMPAYFERAQQMAKALQAIDGLVINPKKPQANMMHLHFPAGAAAIEDARDRIAAEQKVWLGAPRGASEVPGWCSMEIYVGENLMALSDEFVVNAYSRLLDVARKVDQAGA